MDGRTNSVLVALEKPFSELIIPVYQRNYDWQLKQCERLFDDLEEILETDRTKHFFGAIVLKPSKFDWLVIDGQQRLTTISLLLLALVRAIEDGDISASGDELATKIEHRYLRYSSDSADPSLKLKPVKDDATAYNRLFHNESDTVASSNVTANYKFFRERLTATKFSADEIFEAIERLEIMDLSLEEFDEPQRIFETLNSTGLELKEADKVRNFVLMGNQTQDQEDLYEKHWNRIEKNSEFETDKFIRAYLTHQTGSIPRQQDVYEAFKTFAKQRGLEMEELLADMHAFSRYYKQIRKGATGLSSVDPLLDRMQPILGDVTMPFLMPILRDVEQGTIGEEDLLGVLKTVESYLSRRFIVGVAANALNKIFATAYNEVVKLRGEGDSFTEVFSYTLLRRSVSGRFPTDEEFSTAFRTRNMYNIVAAWRGYIYDVMENGDSRDVRDVARALASGDISVEHVMPQTLTDAWRSELGPNAESIHSIWLHRMGNLTVTGYNGTYSNASYQTKKTLPDGFDRSPYRLNRLMKIRNHWGEAEMEERTNELLRQSLDYWKYPVTDFQPPKETLPTESMGDETSFKGREIVAFSFEGLSKTVESWSDMLHSLMLYLMRDHRSEIVSMAGDKGVLVAHDREDVPNGFKRIDDSIIIFTAQNTDTKLAFLRGLFADLGLDSEELLFTLRPDRDSNAEEAAAEASARPYASVTKYLEQLDEARALGEGFQATETLRERFQNDFTPFACENAAEILGHRPIFEVLENIDPNTVDTEFALAAITQLLAATAFAGQSFLHQKIIDGTLGAWVARLQTPPTV